MRKLLTFIFLLHLTRAFAQNTPPLERIISVKVNNEKVDNALKTIANAGNFSFSYNPDELGIDKRVSVNAQNQPVREVLNLVFGNTTTFKNKGNYIILKKSTEEIKKDFFVMGYVSDGETGLKIDKASVYEPVTLASAVTNQYGYYRLKIPVELSNVNIQVRKHNYHYEEVAVKSRQDKTLNITLLPIKLIQIPNKTLKPIQIKTDTLPTKRLDSIPAIQIQPIVIEKKEPEEFFSQKYDYREHWNETKEKLVSTQRKITDWFISTKQNIHLDNIQDTLYRPVQISLLPFIGSNHYLSGNVINDYSLNLIAGYSLGVRKLEVGGMLNIVRGRVTGIQASGFGNLVGENVRGIQAAGFANVVGQNASGIQAAGFSNLVFRNYSGIQASGFSNVVLNSTKSTIQASGFGNVVLGNGSGIQAAGFTNFTGRNFSGIQASGYLNFVGGTFKGIQVSTVNMARKVNNGLQVGVINWAGESNSIPIGLLSYVSRGGYRRLELSTDEVNLGNISFKTGVKRFYNIFTVGYNFNQPNKPLYSFGYGLGTAWRLNRTFWLNFDVVSSHLQNDFSEWKVNQLIRGSLGLEVHLTPRIALFAAPTINLHGSEQTEINMGELSRFKIYEGEGRFFGERATLISWIGYQAGIRIGNR